MGDHYEALYNLRCDASDVHKSSQTVDLRPCDNYGKLLARPEIDQADEPPLYSVSINSDEQTLALIDPVSLGVLCSVSSAVPNKLRHIHLHNPELLVEFKNRSLISFEWKFAWEDMRFAWGRARDTLSTRDSGYTLRLGRKPDPDVVVAVYKQHKRGNLIQIFDYNLNRFTFNDRRGFEYVLLATLFSIVNGEKLDELARSGADGAVIAHGNAATALSPRPQLKTTVSDEVETGDPNEIIVSAHLSETAYIEHCLNLLLDPNLIYLSLTASTPDCVARVVAIASEVKRKQLKGPPTKEELMQFIDYPGRTGGRLGPTVEPLKGRRGSSSHKDEQGSSAGPPSEIKIYLSRIPLEEFVPQRPGSSSSSAPRYPPEKALASKQPRSQVAAPSDRQRLAKPSPPLPPKKVQSADSAAKSDAEGSSRTKSFWQKVTS